MIICLYQNKIFNVLISEYHLQGNLSTTIRGKEVIT
nr:MAG TPA: hypothetical protein [Caudoviricetes sp.]